MTGILKHKLTFFFLCTLLVAGASLATSSALDAEGEEAEAPFVDEEDTHFVPVEEQEPQDIFPVESLVTCNPTAAEEDKVRGSVDDCLAFAAAQEEGGEQ